MQKNVNELSTLDLPVKVKKTVYERSKYWCCIIEKFIKTQDNSLELALSREFLINQLKFIARDYFGILHNMECTREHYHVVIFFDSVISKNKLLTLLSVLLRIPKECITCTPSVSLRYDVSYITHKVCSEKYQYDDNQVFTNNTDLYFSLTNTDNNYSIDNLISICSSCKTLTDVIRVIGIDYFEKHCRLITQLYNDSKMF